MIELSVLIELDTNIDINNLVNQIQLKTKIECIP